MRRARGGLVRLLAGPVVALALGLSGCAGLPRSGPVVEAGSTGAPAIDTGGAAAVSPRPPVPGQSATEVVRGFLDAMQAWPAELSTAREFLAADARTAWAPRGTVLYDDVEPPQGSSNRVSVRLSGAVRLDRRGAWQGRLSSYDSLLQLTLVEEDGELRISNPPENVVVPRTWFEQRYVAASVYFLDPSSSIVVPEPVYVGGDDTLASTLVSDLLRGPGALRQRVVRTALPAGLRLDLSVPVTDGTAAISLVGDGTLDPDLTADLVAQLAWTLRQDPEVEAFTLSVGGQQVRGPGGTSRFAVEEGRGYDPVDLRSVPLLYGLRDGVLVSGTASSLQPVTGPLGSTELGLRSVGVNLGGTTAAGVSADGTAVVMAPVLEADAEVDTTVSGSSDLLPPMWDHRDRMWLVDRTPTGAQVTWRRGEESGVVEVPGITGEQVSSAIVSRDGTRLVVVVRGEQRDVVRIARIRSDAEGAVTGATAARTLTLEDPSNRIRDIAWSSTTTVAVLHRVSSTTAKVTTVGVDGAPGGLASSVGVGTRRSITATLTGATALAGSPVEDETVYAVSRTGLSDVAATVRGPRIAVDGLTFVDHVG